MTWLTWMADEFRAAGLSVVEFEGWQTRCKSSGEYASGRPWGVMWHHSASSPNTSAQNLAEYCCYGADAAPVCNVNIERDASVWILAAGPTNTNGKGSNVTWSKGRVPNDSMNSYAFGMEITNNGVGEPYSEAQINTCFIVSNIVNRMCGNRPDDIALHNEWAPDRKIDPAKAGAVQGPWRPRSTGTSSDTWEGDDVRAECMRRAQQQPSGEDDMLLYVEVSDAWARFVATGQKEPLVLWQVGYSAEPRAAVHRNNLPHVTVSKAQLSGYTLIGALPPQDDGGGPGAPWKDSDFYEQVL